MQSAAETDQTLSIERKLKLHEARESIIGRLAANLPTSINLDSFLKVVVAELGRMMEVDRCDIIKLSPEGELSISHEWRASEAVPSSLNARIPVDAATLAQYLDVRKPIRLDDTSAPELDHKVRFFAKSLGTRSLLVVPVVLGDEVLGLIGLHHTRTTRHWSDEEVAFLVSIAMQLAIGYQYTRIYNDKKREAETTKALLEIANALNARSDFGEVTSAVLERALSLVGADYCALGVLDAGEKRISLAAFKAAPHATTDNVRGLIEAHGQSLDITGIPAMVEVLSQGRTLKLLESDLPLPMRVMFNATLGGRAALVAPVRIGGHAFGLLGLVWSEPRDQFKDHEVALVEGIADQIGTALERDHLSAEVMRLKSALHERYGQDRIIGQARGIRRAMELALSVADTQTSVLIQGESGTGKELLANLIHFNSGREDQPYIKLNCGAIPETLLESELFGHEKGAFTDARARRQGRFQDANNGTLFLDEVGEMTLAAQVRLLRVLQDGEFTRVGGNEVLKADVRIIAASNVDLERAVDEGRFRRDLFYRLSVFPITLPSLRERREDIHPLVIHFLEHYKQRTGRFVSGISKAALRALISYDWPGNVRELENAVERAVIIAAGRQIEIDDLPAAIGNVISERQALVRVERAQAANEGRSSRLEIDVPASMDEIERHAIEATLDYTSGDKTKAARLLNIGRKTIYRKLEQYNGRRNDSESSDT
ncbi:MAG: two-component system, NtrC family, response regulator AtoC [Blastocatellia bacterium]|jgi:transcriptional regulator with GAF, ATPase, and Fis domain|nr:two-component system, NtrC family, response regulator AtoC [Blastocatellia bacterium]